MSTILKLQKKVLRIITSSHPRTASGPLFDRFKILPIDKVYTLNVALFMYKFA